MNRRLSIAQKADILTQLSQPGSTQSSVARSMHVSRKTVRNIMAKQDLLRHRLQDGKSIKKCHLKVNEKYVDVNEATFLWFKKMRERHGEIPVTEMVVCRKAAEFGSKLGHEAFMASKGWFRSWKNKYGLTLYKVSVVKRRILFLLVPLSHTSHFTNNHFPSTLILTPYIHSIQRGRLW